MTGHAKDNLNDVIRKWQREKMKVRKLLKPNPENYQEEAPKLTQTGGDDCPRM